MNKIALVGNPNSGKTSLFNLLTGSVQYVGNWPGVTMEKKEGYLKGAGKEYKIVDLPGIYSLSPFSLDEVVARNYILQEKPDVILNIVDVSNIERNLYLTTQLLELNVPMIIAFNMMDIIEKRGDELNIKYISDELSSEIIPISVAQNHGIDSLIDIIKITSTSAKKLNRKLIFNGALANAINEVKFEISDLIKDGISAVFTAIKVIENDKHMMASISLSKSQKEFVDATIKKIENKYDDDIISVIISKRYEYIRKIIEKSLIRPKEKETMTDKIDNILTNKFLAIPIFFVIMWGMYYVSIQVVGEYTEGFMDYLINDLISGSVYSFLNTINASQWVISMVIDGIIQGVGGVLTFVPMLLCLFLIISFLEDCGYMSRVAFIMDKIFRKFGLSGKSFIPMVLGVGCSIPGIMACRSIESDRERRMTIILTPFIPCGAKLPVFALFAGAFFPDKSYIGPSMYIFGIIMVMFSGFMLKNTLFKGDNSPFVMELPNYRIPKVKNLLMHAWDRGKSFIIKAGTIILAASAVVWFLQSFNFSFDMVSADQSILSSVGKAILPVFVPLGFGSWEASVATLTGIIAKENIVAAFEILSEDFTKLFTPLSAYAFMIFTLLASPCVAAISAMRRELGSWKWTLTGLFYQTGMAWMVAMVFYQAGSIVTNANINLSDIIILFVVVIIIVCAIISGIKNSKNVQCSGSCTSCTQNKNCKL